MSTETTTKRRHVRTAPPVEPSAADIAALDRIASRLERPDRFRAWLAGLPPDRFLAPGGANDRYYWIDPAENPLGVWLRASCGRAVWVHRVGLDRCRLLCAHTWLDVPEWAVRFLRLCRWHCAELAACRDAAAPRSPTPGVALPLLERALAEGGDGEAGKECAG